MRRLFLLFLLIIWPAVLSARGIEPELVAEGPAPPGGEVELAIHMRPAPGWHGYWLNPGDAGLPMDVQWHLPNGFAAGPLRYPVPTRLTVAGLMNYVFERDYAVLVRLKVPAGAKGTIPVRADARWLACTDKICVPEQGQLALDIPVGTGTPNRKQFDAWRQALPQPLATVGHFAVAGDRLRVAIPLPGTVDVREPYVFPITDNVVDYEAPQSFKRSGDWVVAELAMKTDKRVRHSLFARPDSAQLDRIARTLDLIQLMPEADKLAGLLSHGQKQLLEIGMLIMQEPKLLLLDEPVAGMTDEETHRTAELLAKLKGEHSVVVVEHDMEFISRIAATVTVLHEGSVLAEGPMEQVKSDERVIEVYLGR